MGPLIVICCGCSINGEVNGELLDANIGKPIPCAAVAAAYYVEKGTIGGQVNQYIDAAETTSDSDGKFSLPGRTGQPQIYVFAPGYESVCTWREQAESRVDATNVPVGANTYRTIARPIVTTVTNTQGVTYQFRLSRLESAAARQSDVSGITIYQPGVVAGKMTNFIKAVNSERKKYGWRDLYIR